MSFRNTANSAPRSTEHRQRANMESSGSPPSKRTSGSFRIFEDGGADIGTMLPPRPRSHARDLHRAPSNSAMVYNATNGASSQLEHQENKENQNNPVDVLLSRITERQLNVSNAPQQPVHAIIGTASPTVESFPDAGTHRDQPVRNATSANNELLTIKQQLELATKQVALYQQQLVQERHQRNNQVEADLTQAHIARHTVEEAIGSPYPGAQNLAFSMGDMGLGHNLSSMNMSHLPTLSRQPSNIGGHFTSFTPPVTPFEFQHPFGIDHGQGISQQAPIGTRVSPTEFQMSAPWAPSSVLAGQSGSYLSGAEPLNYRRLLERNMSCNWKHIVDKIVCNNDQQASIFLQQKLKTGTPDQKFEIVQCIIDQAYPLMINRFGNFLVQRCFEHGTPEQIVAIASTIRGNTLNLSMDAFGCHVVQKAFDCVPEEYKAIMVHELLRRIPETVIHRYACHVWQKLFELQWSGSPPQIMRHVNEALFGMWHEVALGETGSLVVQNIFENCLEEDKRACINEVLASIDVVAHGQFGNWCIQHICEHGSIPDQNRAIEHVLRFAAEYSMDQYASKVVEKCLKVGGPDFLDRYLDRVCEARPERPRMPLIDIAGDQYGNYLIQYILTHADQERREVVAAHIRRHTVSLRGSKYGSRVAMHCTNPAFATRPGPPAGYMGPNRQGPRYNDGYGGYPAGRGDAGERSYGGAPRGYYGGYR